METDLLTRDEQFHLAARVKQGDIEARNEFVIRNLQLVVSCAKKYYIQGTAFEDLIQEGCLGLIRASELYDPQTFNTTFSTYAVQWIRSFLQKLLERNFSLIRCPYYKFRNPDFRPVLCRTLGENEIGEGMSLDDVFSKSRQRKESMCKDEDFDLLWEAISKLSDLEQYVISRRFGLHGISASNLDHISAVTGVSSRSVRVIEKRALSRLREIMSLDNLSSRVQ